MNEERLDPDTSPTVDPARLDPPSTGDAGAAAPGRHVGPYRVLSEIGRGGMGVVYKAFHPALKRTVALKVLMAGEDASDEAIERFHREGEAVARLGHHPHIVPVYDIGTEGRTHYIAMHFVEGVALDRRIDEGAMDPRRAGDIARNVASALAHAHGHGILHRDVKPANILLALPEGERGRGGEAEHPSPPPPLPSSPPRAEGRHGVPMLTDFGLAKDVRSESRMTRSGVTLGTPHYMPPEQAEGRLDAVDERSDVYSLGATLYEMLTTQPPFEGASVSEVIHKVLLKDPVAPRRLNPEVERDLETICLKCLEKDPARRYPSAATLAADLGRYLDERPIQARPVSLLEKLGRRARRNKAAAAALAALAVLLPAGALAAVVGLGWGSRQTERAKKAEQEKVTARAHEEDAKQALQKGQNVMRVLLAATQTLAPAEREIRQCLYSRANYREELGPIYERHEKTIEDFVRTFEGDPASRATALAFKGWLLFLAVDLPRSRAALHDAQHLDPDVPWGFFFDAVANLTLYLWDQPIPTTLHGPEGVEFGDVPPETPFLVSARARFEALLGGLASARVWSEGARKDLGIILEGFQNLHGGDPAAAERGLERALRVPEFFWVRDEIQLALTKVLHLQKNFDGGLAVVRRLLERHPDFSEGLFYEAHILHARGMDAWARGEDPVPVLREAIGAYGRTLEITPGLFSAHLNRSLAWANLAEALAAAGDDPRAAYAAAIEDATVAQTLHPEDARALVRRARALAGTAKALAAGGEEAGAALAAALRDLDAAEALDTADEDVLVLRGDIHLDLGTRAFAGGQDPREALDRAVDSYTRALEADGALSEARNNRGMARRTLGEFLLWVDEDPTEALTAALADFDAVLLRYPKLPEARVNRGNTLLHLAKAAVARKEDARPLLTRTVVDFEEALRLKPDYAEARSNLGNAYSHLAQAEQRAGGDPRPMLNRALRCLEESLERLPGSPVVLVNLGAVLRQLADAEDAAGGDGAPLFERALSCYGEAGRRAPSFWQAWYNKGVLLEHLGRDAEAFEAFARAVLDGGDGGQYAFGSLVRSWAAARKSSWHRELVDALEAMGAGDYAGARPLLEGALETARAEGAHDHPAMARALSGSYYNLACILSLAAAGKAGPGAQPAGIAEEEAGALRSGALEALKTAWRLGWRDFGHAREDSDLDPLRAGGALEALFAEWEGKDD